MKVVRECGLTGVQLQGEETPQYIKDILRINEGRPLKVIKTFSANAPYEISTAASAVMDEHVDAFRGKDLQRLLAEGARYVIERDLGETRDVDYAEAHGHLDGVDGSQADGHGGPAAPRFAHGSHSLTAV